MGQCRIRPGLYLICDNYGPHQKTEVDLALEVLDRVVAFESEWRDILAESDDLTPALAELDKFRKSLQPSTE